MVKRICVAAVLVFAAATVLAGQTTSRGAGRAHRPRPRRADAAGELTRIEAQWHKALEKADVAALDSLLAPGWFITNGSGAIIPKSELLGALRSGEIKFVSTVPTEIKVHVYSQAAVVTKRSTDQTLYGSSPGGGRYQMTDMFVKLDGRWQCIATHASRDLKP
jgi:predicted small secreted protein